jgi:Flp pilus assembly protein TadG
VEFSLVLPVFLVLLLAVFEFALLFNALLSINYATRDAALVAAEAGNAPGSDCVILRQVDADVTAPAEASAITKVRIFWTNSVGDPLDMNGSVTTDNASLQAQNVYRRGGTTTCHFADGSTLTAPYTLQGTAQYPENARCSYLQGVTAGCAAGHNGLDTVAVQVTYVDTWHTPLHLLIGPLGTGRTLIQTNAMRMEPIL